MHRNWCPISRQHPKPLLSQSFVKDQSLIAQLKTKYIFSGNQRNSNWLAPCHLHLRTIAVIRGVENNHLVSMIHQAQNTTVKTINSSHGNTNVVFWVKVTIGCSMKISNSFDVVQRSKASHILMRAYISLLILFVTASSRCLLKNSGGPKEGKPCPRFRDFVWMAKGVITLHTVGLLMPLSLLASSIGFFID